MGKISVGPQDSGVIEIYCEDHGTGQSAVPARGCLLNGHSWKKQERALLQAGYQVIAYGRRGFGHSCQHTTARRR